MTVATFPRSRSRRAPSRVLARQEAGFTLVEVSLAIGIVAFAFVAIFGLLPVGMTNFRKSLDTALTTEIAQRVINDLKQSDFETVRKISPGDATSGGVRYFSEQGDEVDLTKDANKRWLYYGEISIGAPPGKDSGTATSNSTSTTLPGAPNPTPNLLTVIIKLGANPGKVTSPSPFGESNPKKIPYRTFIALVARNQ